MYIATYSNWYLNWSRISLFRKNCNCSVCDELNLLLSYRFEIFEVIYNGFYFNPVRHYLNIYLYHLRHNSMLSDKEIRSMIWNQFEPGEEEVEGGEEEQVLDLSHQQLRKLREFSLKDLEVQRVNASYNFFKDFVSLNFKEFKEQSQNITVRWLDISFNFIKQIDQSAQSCHILKFLRYLNISANQLQSVDFSALDLPLLQTLNLNNNKIKFFLHCPPKLKVLSINDNNLSSLAFTGGESLNILTAKKNAIKKIGLTLGELSVFDVEENKIDDIDMVREFLKKNPHLLAINFRDNPIGKAKDYKIAVLENCRQIGQIDSILINPHIREGFKILKAEQQLNDLLDKVNKKYQMKLVQKQKIKKDLIRKIRAQQKMIVQNYDKSIKEERQQFQIIQKKTQEKLAKKKLAAPAEKNSLSSSLMDYANKIEEIVENQDHAQTFQNQNRNEYLDYLNKHKPYSQNQDLVQKIKKSRNKSSSKADIQILPELSGIKLFDEKSIDILLDIYSVNIVQF